MGKCGGVSFAYVIQECDINRTYALEFKGWADPLLFCFYKYKC